MKKLLLISLLITASCNEKLHDSYRGYVYNLKKEPLSGVIVCADVVNLECTKTNKNGCFLLKRGSQNFVDDLIFVKDGYITDSLETVYYKRGHGTIYLFLTNRSDTLFMEETKQITLPNNGYK